MEFIGFPKMGRLSREIVITEKLDGTNAQLFIDDITMLDGDLVLFEKDGLGLMAGSRTRWIKPGDDNFAFAQWAQANGEELLKLGTGQHFGEWWGKGIQRNYGLQEKKFSLFNSTRWTDDTRPACCDVVPELYRGMFSEAEIDNCIAFLRGNGSVAAPGFMDPEGIIIYHTSAGVGFKKTLKNDEVPKGLVGGA